MIDRRNFLKGVCGFIASTPLVNLFADKNKSSNSRIRMDNLCSEIPYEEVLAHRLVSAIYEDFVKVKERESYKLKYYTQFYTDNQPIYAPDGSIERIGTLYVCPLLLNFYKIDWSSATNTGNTITYNLVMDNLHKYVVTYNEIDFNLINSFINQKMTERFKGYDISGNRLG